MRKAFQPVASAAYLAVCATILMWITGQVGPVLNIKQAVAVEVIFLGLTLPIGWHNSEYPEELARFLSAFGALVGTVFIQVVMIAAYFVYNWVMA